jgi:hypothetical protein
MKTVRPLKPLSPHSVVTMKLAGSNPLPNEFISMFNDLLLMQFDGLQAVIHDQDVTKMMYGMSNSSDYLSGYVLEPVFSRLVTFHFATVGWKVERYNQGTGFGYYIFSPSNLCDPKI